MKRLALLLAAALLLATPALAHAGPVEDASAAVERSEREVRELEGRRRLVSGELDQVAARIEQRKEEARRSGALLPDGELTELLQRSQELAQQLASLHRSEAAARAGLHRSAEALAGACSAEIDRTRDDRTRLARLQDLRDRARSLLAAKPASAPVAIEASDDPGEIREQADLLRDQRDRVVKRIGAIERRLAELREEAEVARELRDFLDEGDLFDESDRVLAVRESGSRGTTSRTGSPEAPPSKDGSPSGAPEDVDGLGEGDPVPGVSTPLAPPTTVGLPQPALTHRLGTSPEQIAALGLPPLDGDESLEELISLQAALRTLARSLDGEAKALDDRARVLDRRE